MRKSELTVMDTKNVRQFIDVLLSSNSKPELKKLLRDVMTESELIEVSARLEAARLLKKGFSYETIRNKTKLSFRTIARISKWVKDGSGGYINAIRFLESKHDHK